MIIYTPLIGLVSDVLELFKYTAAVIYRIYQNYPNLLYDNWFTNIYLINSIKPKSS